MELYSDHEGTELDGVKAAHDDAIGVIDDPAREKLPDRDRHEFTCEVCDETGKMVFKATLTLSSEWPS
jgi:hypothetical protein